MTAPATARQDRVAGRQVQALHQPSHVRRTPTANRSRPQPGRRTPHRGPRDIHPRPGHIPGLDGIRALAILGVLVFHFTPTVLPGGFLGVDVFFVVSGFLITTLLLREISRRGRIDLPQFWLRRARRLLPALLTVVVVSIGAARLVGGDLLVAIGRQALGALTFSTNWVEVAAGASYFHSTSPLLFVNFWSLAVEEQFYLLWPFGLVLALAFTRDTRQRLYVAGGLALVSAVLMAALYRPGEDATRVYYGTDTHLFGLMLGVGLAFAWAGPERAWLRTAAWRRWRGVAVAVALAVLVLLMARLGDTSAWTFRGGILLACVATVVLIAGLLESAGSWRTLMQVQPLVWLGQRSYGIYLWHWPVLMIAAELFPFAQGTTRGWIVLGSALTLTLAISEVSHRWIEIPVRRHGFASSLHRLGSWAATPWETDRIPRVAAGALAGLFLLSAVAVATAPEESATQRAIEASEAELNGAGREGTSEAAPPTDPDAGTSEDASDAGSPQGLLGELLGRDGLLDTGRGPAPEDLPPSVEGAGEPTGSDPQRSQDEPGPTSEDEGAVGDTEGTGTRGGSDGGPLGYTKDDSGLWVPAGNDITAIGDSLVITSADGLKYRFPDISFVAKSNRQWKDARPVLAAALAEGTVRDNVIVHFGTNAGVDEDALRAFLDDLGPERNVVVVNLYGSSTFVPGSNAAIERVVTGYPNAVVGDWQAAASAQPETLQSDRIHPDIEGMHVYAQMVAESFDALARRS